MATAATLECPTGLPDIDNLRISEDPPQGKTKKWKKKKNKKEAAKDDGLDGPSGQMNTKRKDPCPTGTNDVVLNDEASSSQTPVKQDGVRPKRKGSPRQKGGSSPDAPFNETQNRPVEAKDSGPPRERNKSPPKEPQDSAAAALTEQPTSQTEPKAKGKRRRQKARKSSLEKPHVPENENTIARPPTYTEPPCQSSDQPKNRSPQGRTGPPVDGIGNEQSSSQAETNPKGRWPLKQKERHHQYKSDVAVGELANGWSTSQPDSRISPTKQKHRSPQKKPQEFPSSERRASYGQNQRQQSPRRNGHPSHQPKTGESRFCAQNPPPPVETLRRLIDEGTCLEGTLRINQRNSEDAFVTLSEGAEGGRYQWDIHLEGSNNRGRALNGDQVAVELLPKEKWKIQLKAIQQWETDNKTSLPNFLRTENVAVEVVESSTQNSDSTKATSDAHDGESCDTVDSKGCDTVDGTVTHQNGYPIELILKHPEWGRFVQRTGRVVGIMSESGPRVGCGHLRRLNPEFWHQLSPSEASGQQKTPGPQLRPKAALFVPQDKRFPHLWIPAEQCPKDFFQRPQDYSNVLYCARLEQWPDLANPNGHWELPRGEILKLIGRMGDVESETVAILTGQMIDFEEYTEDILDDLPVAVNSNWTIPPKELESRRDFRRQLVISVDPSTARDLDDALSVRQIDDDLYEVGVHIADLSYFIPPGCKLDKKAQNRATSVYLVQKVIPMLPRVLCNDLCSLTSGVDKLTFSVVWKMNSEGEVFDEWFGRSVINSSCQLSYEHAQQMIDSPDHQWKPEELPTVHGCWTATDISGAINILNKMAIKMRERRVANGCLRLDQIRLQFALANDGTTPQGFSIYEHSESHKLIEEFMLQANMAVAHRLVKYFPKMAFLRNHPSPDWRRLETTVRSCSFTDLKVEAKSSGDLQKSLFKIADTANRFEVLNSISARLDRKGSSAREALMSALCNVLAKPFRPATYFVAGSLPSPEHYRHFALAVPLYTHFTSPIRRYADLVVHRLLAASLDLTECPYNDVASLQQVATHCNERKYAAKTAQELSVELFVWTFISKLPGKQMKDEFIVVGPFDKSVDVMSLSTGLVHRAYVDKQGVSTTRFSNDPDCLILVYDSTKGPGHEETLKLSTLSAVRGVVTALPNVGKYLVTLDSPPNAIRASIGDQSCSQSSRTPRFSKP